MRASSTLLLFVLLGLLSCTSEVEIFESEKVQEYMNPQVGKYITYRTDSTVFTNFGRTTEVHSYQEKHVVDAQVSDALGRPSFRILKFIRNVAGTQAWKPSGSYLITISNNTVEVNENNLRFLKLVQPIKQDFTWKGNRYLPNDPYGSLYIFSNDDNIADWESSYVNLKESASINGKNFDNVITVKSVDEAVNVPISSPDRYALRNYSEEKYAKGVGLIYQELIMWEFQPNTSGPSAYYVGFGVKRSILDRN